MHAYAAPCVPMQQHALASLAVTVCAVRQLRALGVPLNHGYHCPGRCMTPSTFRYKANKTIFTADYWRVGWFADVTRYAEALAPVLQAHFGTTKLLAGDTECCSCRVDQVWKGS